MDKSNKIENLANKYVERHIRDRHLSDDTIKEIKIAYIMIIKDFIAIVDASGVLTVMMHGDREDNPIPEMLPNAGTNPDNIITTISGIGNDGGDW